MQTFKPSCVQVRNYANKLGYAPTYSKKMEKLLEAVYPLMEQDTDKHPAEIIRKYISNEGEKKVKLPVGDKIKNSSVGHHEVQRE